MCDGRLPPRAARRASIDAASGRLLACALAALGLVSLGACRQDMQQGPRFNPLAEASEVFGNGSSARTPVPGTVARGNLRENVALYTGRAGDAFVAELPVEFNRALVERGQERFNVYCSPCHGRTGEGNGMVVQRGFKAPVSLHDPRLRAERIGYFFDVMTNGFGMMPSYAAQIAPRDRWAVAAYLRTLQFSRRASIDDVPESDRPLVESGGMAGAGVTPGETTPHE